MSPQTDPSPLCLCLGEQDRARLAWKCFDATPRAGCAGVAMGNKFVVVGGEENGVVLSRAEMFDPETKSWTTLPPMPTPRSHCAVVSFQNRIMVVGGRSCSGKSLNTVEMLHLHEWTSLASMGMERCGCAAVMDDSLCFVIGGKDSSGRDIRSITAFDFDADHGVSWVRVAHMRTPCSYCLAAIVKEGIYIFGGQSDGETLDRCMLYDRKNGCWNPLPPMPGPREGGAAVAVGNQILLLGGTNGTTPLDRVDLFDTETYAWATLPTTNQRGLEAAALVQNEVLAVGGNGMERLLWSASVLELPVLPPLPTAMGRASRRASMRQWMHEVQTTKQGFLQRGRATRETITANYHAEKRLLQTLLAKLEWNHQYELETIRATTEGWCECVDDHVAAMEGQILALEELDEAPNRKRRRPYRGPHLVGSDEITTNPVVAADDAIVRFVPTAFRNSHV